MTSHTPVVSPHTNPLAEDHPTSLPKAGGISLPSILTQIAPRLLLVLVVIASVWLTFAPFTPPAVVPATAPASEFSAERAMTDLRAIARVPHPTGSAANAAVRAYLLERIRALGLQPEVQTTTVVQHWPGEDSFWAGTVNNVVVRLPGTASTRAILLDAHYDSVPTSPGAGDNGSGVVTLLETLRALMAGPPLKNDIIFVFADGEERMDLGAHAFATQHPWMQDVGLAINFEALGSGGATQLFDSSPQDGWLITESLKAIPDPLVNSAWVNLFKFFATTRLGALSQLGCDLQEYLDQGSAGLDFIHAGDLPAYHTMRDNAQVIDPRSIQHDGSYALSLVRHFGGMDLSHIPQAPDEVYFMLLPGVVAHYPSTWAVPLAISGLLLFLGVLTAGFRRKHLTIGGFLLGILIFPLSLVGTLILLMLLWWALMQVNSNYQVFMAGSYGLDLTVLGLAGLAIAATSALFLWLRKQMRLYNLAAGALVWWAVLLLLSSLFSPTSSALFTWPLLFALLALGWLFLAKDSAARPWLRATILSVAMAAGIIALVPLVLHAVPLMSYIEAQVTFPLLPIPLLLVVLLMGLLLPQLDLLAGTPHTAAPASGPVAQHGLRRLLRVGHWLVPIASLLLSVVLLITALGMSSWSATRPGTDSVTYQLNADTGQALWRSLDHQLDAWTHQFFPTSSGQGPFQAKAPTVALAAPTVTLTSDTMSSGTRTLQVQVASPRQAEDAIVEIETQSTLIAATVDGHPFDLSMLAEGVPLQFTYYALPTQGFALRLSLTSTAPVKIIVQDVSNGLPPIPGMTIKPRPASLMPNLNPWRDPTIVIKSFLLAR